MTSAASVLATIEAEERFLLGRQAVLKAEVKKHEDALNRMQFELDRNCDYLALIKKFKGGVDSPDAHVQAPPGPCVGQHDWIISLLRANPAGLTQKQFIDYLVPRIQTKQKSPEKAIRDALSHLVRAGRIQMSNGVYRMNENLVR